MPLQIRRGTEDQRQEELVDLGKPLLPGEPLYVTDDQRLYIGDGVTPGGVLVTGFNANDALVSAANGLVAGNAFNPNISFLYGLTQQSNNRIEARIDLSSYNGEIGADAFRGSVLASDSSTLVNYLTAAINLDGTIKGDAIPFDNQTWDLGDSSHRFKKLFLSDSGISIGMADITANGLRINLPANSTVGGVPIAAIAPGVDYQVNIISADSTRIVDSQTATFRGTFDGDLSGSVFSDNSTRMVDATDLKVFANNGLYGDVKNFSEETALRVFDRKAFLQQLRFGSTTALGTGVIEGTDVTALLDTITFVSEGPPSPTTPAFSLLSASNTNDGDTIALVRQRGTAISPLPVQNNDEIGALGFAGFDGATYKFAGGVVGFVDGTVSTNIVPTRLELKVNNSAGTEITVARVKSTHMEMNGLPFKLPVYADDTARNAAIPAPEAGMMCFVISGTTPAGSNRAQVNTNGSVGGWANLN